MGLRLRLLGLALLTGMASQYCVTLGPCAAPLATAATAGTAMG